MRIRGRRVALLLASALPLLADDRPVFSETISENAVVDVPVKKSISLPQHIWNVDPSDDDENDEANAMRYTASEAIHNERFRLPPLPATEIPLTPHKNPNTFDEEESSNDKMMNTAKEPKENSSYEVIDTKIGDEEADDEENQMEVAVETNRDSAPPNPLEASKNNGDSKNVVENKIGEDSKKEEKIEISSTTTENSPTIEQQTPPKSEKGSENKHEETEVDDEDEEVSLSHVSVDYASKSAGALVIEKSNGFKGTSNLLNGDKDRYAIAPCDEKKFVVISLSEDILVKQIKLSNYERFSSSVKDFQVMGSQTLGKWFDLGTYTAKAGNGEQSFDLAEPAWARYLKFKFLSHHGVEYYCTYSQIQVHGSTMVQGFHEQWEESEVKEIEEHQDDKATKEINDEPTKELEISVENTDIENESSNQSSGQTSSQSTCIVESCGIGSLAAARPLHHSSQLESKLQGALSDTELFSSLYDLIPSTLNALPVASRSSPGRQTSSGELRSLHQIGSLAMQSIMSNSKIATDSVKSHVPESTPSISTPRMTDRMGDVLSHYLGTELGLLTSKWINPDVWDPKTRLAHEAVEIITNHSELKDESNELSNDEPSPAKNEPTKTIIETTNKILEEKTETDDTPSSKSEVSQEEVDSAKGMGLSAAAMDITLARLLENLPSAECLSKLDLSEFKAKATTSKKTPSGSGASGPSGSNPMEPIFKKLTDEIRSLQSSLLVHDQFTRASVECYQRVLLDLIVDMESLRQDHDERLRTLETSFRESRATFLSRLWRSIFQLLRAISSWIYSTFVHIYTPLLVWCMSLCKGFLRIPGILYRHALLRWPAVKTLVLLNEDGSPSEWAKILRPLTDQIDQLVVAIEFADSNFSPEEASLIAKENDDMWKFPVLPIILLILTGRLVMCFANPSIRVARFSTEKEPVTVKLNHSSPTKSASKESSSRSTNCQSGEQRTESFDKGQNNNDVPKSFRRADDSAYVDVSKENTTKSIPPSQQKIKDCHESNMEESSPPKRMSRIPLPQRRPVISPRNGATNSITP